MGRLRSELVAVADMGTSTWYDDVAESSWRPLVDAMDNGCGVEGNCMRIDS